MTAKHLVRFTTPLINGRFLPAPSTPSRLRALINPCTAKDIVAVTEGSAADVDLAVRAAYDAVWSGEWRTKFTGGDRRDAMFDLAKAMESNKDELAFLETSCSGKPISASLDDVSDSIEYLKYFAGFADKMDGRVISGNGSLSADSSKFVGWTHREPLGVIAAVVSFNYPLSLAMWKLAPALACGNAIVIKPAPQTPLSVLLLGHLVATQTRIPPGVVNVVPGGAEAGAALSNHRLVDKISFTGSLPTGRRIMGAAANPDGGIDGGLKSVTLELGGKSPVIVMDDVDLDAAVPEVAQAIMSNTGQNCCAGSKLYLHEKIHDQFLVRLCEYIAKTTAIGDTFSSETTFGPLVDKTQFERVLSMLPGDQRISESGSDGPRLLMGGGRLAGNSGYFVVPTIYYNVPQSHDLAVHEVFGPVLSVMRPFTDVDAVIEQENHNNPCGLASGIFSQSNATLHKFARKIRSGYVWLNSYNYMPASLPFGGVKQSGFGKDCGVESLNEFTTIKSVYMAT
ncbi:aldehyde dehydrogenase [Ramicandelaber brevisporus]|nr:aldehyde dehydrogenase [Ramicandelaber brevisporus]